jgi:hypothetical protein
MYETSENPRVGRGPGRRSGPMYLALVLILVGAGRSAAGEPGRAIALGEAVPRGRSSRVWIELKASGLFRPALPPGQAVAEARMPKPLSLDVQTRLVFNERVLELAEPASATGTSGVGGPEPRGRGRARKVVRHVIQAASAINGEVRPMAAILRPEVAVLVAERRRTEGPVVVISPAGPLTWRELDVVQGVGDPLALSDLLPPGSVGVGQTWRVGEAAAKGVSEYDAITTNGLEATLESFDADRATVRIQGRIEGSHHGATGLMTCDGVLGFDRRLGWIDRLELHRNESRRPGPVEAGLDMKSTLTVARNADPPPTTLSDAALAGYSLEINPRSERLLLKGPDGKSSLLHDRGWHVFWDDSKMAVLKRLDGGRVVAQCNLVVGPAAGRGRHQDPAQFRDEIRRVLGKRFVNYIGVGEVDGDPAGGYRFKVGVQGREGGLGVVWYYYLVASPAGDQLIVTYTLAAQDARAFGEQDVEMIGTLRWSPPRQPAGRD